MAFKMVLLRPSSDPWHNGGTEEVHYVETAREAETMALTAWPDCYVGSLGRLYVKKPRQVDLDGNVVEFHKTLEVARIEFTDKQ